MGTMTSDAQCLIAHELFVALNKKVMNDSKMNFHCDVYFHLILHIE